jgi:hypothetical protein
MSYLLRWEHTCKITVYHNIVNITIDWHELELQSEISTCASWHNSILWALHRGVPSLLQEPEASWM